MFDVIVIGGGVIGGATVRELSRYDLKVGVLEAEGDVCMGASKANSGVAHAGFDALEGSLKAKFNVLGSKMMEAYAEELGVKYRKNGAFVVAFSDEEMEILYELKARGEKNGVEGLEIIDGEKLRKTEPSVANGAIGALYAPTSGIVCPYELTIASIGNAMDNGAELFTDFKVVKVEGEKENFTLFSEDGREVRAKTVINCAGLFSGEVARLFGDNSFKIGGRKGEYILLDRESAGFVNHTMFFTPTKKGKGVLVLPTADNNILVGPTAAEMDEPNVETEANSLAFIKAKASEMCKDIPFYNTITSFAGVRAFSDRHDFIIEESPLCAGLINCAGIESPGLTSAPAIAKYVVNELIGRLFVLKPKRSFNGRRKSECFFKRLSLEEKNEIIKNDPAYGKIICRCEQITEGEILSAIRTNPKAKDIDGVKRRTRAGMGRCQGGFCQPYVAEIIAREQGVDLTKVTKSGKGSYLLKGETK